MANGGHPTTASKPKGTKPAGKVASKRAKAAQKR